MISLILPVYNEEKNIEKVLDDIFDFFSKKGLPFEVIAVNDGSQDATGNILKNYQGKENLTVISHPKNRGYGAALRSGFKNARGDLIFFMDSDCQFSIKDIELFLEKIPLYDFIIGYRRHRKDSQIRIFYAWLFKIAARMLFRVRSRDVDCAFKLFKKEVIKNITLTETGALINLEILALAQKKGYRFLQLPVNHYPRTSGSPTGGNIKVIFKAVYHMIGLWQRVKKSQHV